MKKFKMSTRLLKASLLIVFAGLLLFATNRGGDSFEIYLNGQRLVQAYVYQNPPVQTLQMTSVSAGDELKIFYNHCGRSGTDRYVYLKDDQDRIVKRWHFPDASGKSGMACPLSDIVSISNRARNKNLNLFYSSKELPDGRLLAALSFGVTVARK
jgi:hypothetical protein